MSVQRKRKKLPDGSYADDGYQVSYKDADGIWRRRSFRTKRDANFFNQNVGLINRLRVESENSGTPLAHIVDNYLEKDKSINRSDLVSLLQRGETREERGKTIEKLVEGFLEDRAEIKHGRQPLKDSTLSTYKTRLQPFVDKHGQKLPREVTKAHGKQYRDWLLKERKNAESAQAYLTTLNTFYEHLTVDLEMKIENPVAGLTVQIPEDISREEVLEDDLYTDEQIEKIIAALTKDVENKRCSYRESRTRDRAVLVLLIYCGLRIGEALALEWDAFDFEKRTVFVSKNLDRKKKITTLKTRAGVRLVNIPKVAMPYIEAWRKLSPDRFSKAGEGRLTYRNFLRTYGAAIKAAEVPAKNIHYMRHYFVSKLIERPEIPESEITRLIGHTDIAFTRRVYGHLLNKHRRSEETGRILDDVFA